MAALEQEMRKKLINFMWVLIWVGAVFDSCFFLYYTMTRTLTGNVIAYIGVRILLPFLLSFAIYEFVKKFDYKSKKPDSFKNEICSYALCLMIGILGIFHSYFTPLWCGSALVIMVSTVFHSERLQTMLITISCGLTVLQTVVACIEHSGQIAFYIESAVVVMVMNIMSYVAAQVILGHNAQIIGMTANLQDTKVEYEEQIQFDMLTTVCSRRYLMERAAVSMKECSPNHPVSVSIIDIDNFKRVNDTYGHENGDVVLNRLGTLLFPHISDTVTVGRYGGEEFVFVFDKTDIHEAEKVVESVLEEFRAQKYDFTDSPITFSGGFVSCYEKMTFEEALEVADQGLYYAKENGKNQIKVQPRILK